MNLVIEIIEYAKENYPLAYKEWKNGRIEHKLSMYEIPYWFDTLSICIGVKCLNTFEGGSGFNPFMLNEGVLLKYTSKEDWRDSQDKYQWYDAILAIFESRYEADLLVYKKAFEIRESQLEREMEEAIEGIRTEVKNKVIGSPISMQEVVEEMKNNEVNIENTDELKMKCEITLSQKNCLEIAKIAVPGEESYTVVTHDDILHHECNISSSIGTGIDPTAIKICWKNGFVSVHLYSDMDPLEDMDSWKKITEYIRGIGVAQTVEEVEEWLNTYVIKGAKS